MNTVPLILASASPRRADVLGMLGIPFEVSPTNVPELLDVDETPDDYVLRLARAKAEAGRRAHPGRWVLAGDTVVAFEGRVLEKPADAGEARTMLLELSGSSHTVHSGLALAEPGGTTRSRVDTTEVWFRDFDAEVAESYISTGEPFDKAGAYGIQGFGAALVERINGDFFTVVGMSAIGLVTLLREAGVPYRFPAATH